MGLLKQFLLAILLMSVGQLMATPKLLKAILDTNTFYESVSSKTTLSSGEVISISNHITRKGYAIAGKVIRASIEQPEAGLLALDPKDFSLSQADREKKTNQNFSFGKIIEGKTDEHGVLKVYFKPKQSGQVELRFYFVNQSTDFAEHQNLIGLHVLGFWQKWKMFIIFLLGLLLGSFGFYYLYQSVPLFRILVRLDPTLQHGKSLKS